MDIKRGWPLADLSPESPRPETRGQWSSSRKACEPHPEWSVDPGCEHVGTCAEDEGVLLAEAGQVASDAVSEVSFAHRASHHRLRGRVGGTGQYRTPRGRPTVLQWTSTLKPDRRRRGRGCAIGHIQMKALDDAQCLSVYIGNPHHLPTLPRV